MFSREFKNTPLKNDDRVKIVGSFDDLISTPMGPTINAMCWQRDLDGNFDEIAAFFTAEEDITSIDEEIIIDMRGKLSPAGRMAADILLQDLRMMQGQGLQPSLECVPRYAQDMNSDIVPTDVYSFHADRAPVAVDTYLCSYNIAATEAVRNDQAQRHIDIPQTREKLHRLFEQEGGGDFDSYLRENCYDLHYAPMTNAVPFSFGLFNMWRIAIEYPGCPVPPCLHRAPKTAAGQLPRLLLIS